LEVKVKWYMFFYERGSAKYKIFDTQEALELEAGKFLFYYKNETDDNYIDIVLKSEDKPYISPFYSEVE
jgi:hypothetical protein